MLAKIIAKIIGLFSVDTTQTVLRIAMWKVFIFLAVGALVPWVVYLGINSILMVLADFLSDKVSEISVGNIIPQQWQVVGTAAWFFHELAIDQAISIILSAVSARIAVRMIPGIGKAI